MDFQLYTDAVLLGNVSGDFIQVCDIGTVVERHDIAGLETGYSVEFFDMLGNTVAVVTLPESMLRSPTHADRPTVRTDDRHNITVKG